ncbi:MAG: type II and III secretion system protein [Candidatus Goldbacteria bacterium]|nr:type II and III secretion system protein [Candidatus Goldiibacteriota bacterium]
MKLNQECKVIVTAIFMCLLGVSVLAAGRSITVKEGGSKVVKTDDVERVEVIKEDVASALIISKKEIIIEGKKEGVSAVNIYGKGGMNTVLINVKKAASSEQMIEVDVQVMEISGMDSSDLGLDWPTLLNGSAGKDGEGQALLLGPLNVAESGAPLLAFGKFSRGNINLFLDFMVKNNYGKILAKPKILTSSGNKAKFLSGGEIPIALVNDNGGADVEWKEYGVSLEIHPEIKKNGHIKAGLKAEVSNLDYANAISLGTGGSVMPALKTRWAETTISVTPEDTIVIAGLIQNEDVMVSSGVPVLSGIPILGELFKNTHKESKKTELVIFVTTRIIDAGEI